MRFESFRQRLKRRFGGKAARPFRKPLSRLPLSIEVLEYRIVPSLAPGVLSSPIVNSGSESPGSGFHFTEVNGKAFFAASDGFHGLELAVSNGTAVPPFDGVPGTYFVKDINPGPSGSNPLFLTNVNGTLFFSADDGSHGHELWRSDGTAAGTQMVADINPGASNSDPKYLTNVNGTLFFSADDGTHGTELWESNGTAAGTFMVQDINPGPAGSNPQFLTNVNGTLFFEANDGTHAHALWESTGTAAGTFLVKDLSGNNSYVFSMTNVNGTLFFSTDDGGSTGALWESDGTAAGTVMVQGNSNFTGVYYLANVNGTLFFNASNEPTTGDQLYESNGTDAGTFMVKDIAGASSASIRYMTNVNGTLFFQADDVIHGKGLGLWESNGTAAGTFQIPLNEPKDPVTNQVFSATNPGDLTNVNGTLFFAAADVRTPNDFEPWSLPLPNSAPIANAGGPYTVTEGSSLQLDASSSNDPDGDPLTYSWTINGHANAATGVKPTLTWAQLQALGIDDGIGSLTVQVTVDDGADNVVTSTAATLTVTDPPVMATGGFTVSTSENLDSGSQTVATFTDPGGAEALADYSAAIDWGDATTSAGTITYNSVTGVFTVSGDHTYGAVGSDPITVTIHHDAAADAVASSSATIVSGVTTTAISAPGIVYGANGMVTVTVSSVVTPTGSVSLSVDGAAAVTQALVNGSTTFTVTGLGAGSHSLSADYLPAAGFDASSGTGTLSVTQAGLTVTANDASKIYGAANPTFTVSYMGFVNADTPAALGGTLTFTTSATAASHVGSYAITPSGLASSNYTITFVSGTLSITPAALTITADNKSKLYGAAQPTLTASYSGFVNGDTAASLTTQPTLSTNATAASHVSGNPYTITASGAVDSDYTITYVAGTLTVTPAALTITAVNQTKAYGAALPTLTASYSGFVNGDTAASLTTAPTLTTNATAASHVSGNPYTITASGAVDSDYTISYVNGTLTVTPGGLTITADNQTKAYGAPLPALTASYTGFVNGDNASSLTTQPTLGTNATAASHVSGNPYTITASGAVDSDYAISYVTGTLTVTPVGLAVTANNDTKPYGAALPTLTASYGGFVHGDTAASLTTAPTLTTNATAASHVSGNPYTITASGAVDSDYTISYVAGTLTVTPVSLTITADNKTKAYSAVLPTLTASYSGFVNGDTAASLTTQPTLSTSATASSHVSGNPYTITASGAVDSDYTISYVNGTLTVTPVALTITADNQTKAYGAAIPTLTASYSGFVNNDTAASLTSQPTLTTNATAASHVSGNPYTITASGGVDSDYTISYVTGTLTVTPVGLTITADNQTKPYGAAVPTLTASYSGFVNGNNSSSLATQPTLTTNTTAASHVSGNPYTITASGAADSDYTISYVSGTLTVIPVALTITADNKTKAYGAALPTLTASYSGFVNGDTAASLSTQPTLSTDAMASSHVSGNPYTITASGAADSDYTISYVSGSLTVTPVALTITADNKTKPYGAALPTLTVSYSGLVNGDSASSLTSAPTLTTNATAASHVSGNPYTITPSGAVDGDYTISYVNGTLTVRPVGLTVTADNKTKVYGAALPALTATYNGFVNGDTAGSLTAAVMLSTTATAASPVDTYAIIASGASDPDYTIAFVAGTLNVTPAALTVTANNVSKVYGSPNPTFTATYTGFVNGDTASSLGGTLSFTTTATTSSPAGTYPITPGGLTSANYNITFVSGVLTVTGTTTTATTTTGTPASASTSLGQPVTLQATVTPNSGTGTPTGSVDFFDVTTNTDLGSVTLVGGSASLTTSRFGLGSQTISLSYSSGDGTFLASSTTVTVTSTAAPAVPTIYVLDPSASSALSTSGSSGINVGGTVYVDSSSASAVNSSGASSITASAIDVVGGVQKGSNVTFSVTPTTGVSSVADPLAAVIAPSTTGLTNYGAISVSGSNSLTINPGIYTQISVSGNGSLTLNPGIYIIEGGGFTVTGHGNLTGNGVLIFNAGSNYPSSGGNFGGITLSSKGTINLSAATSGTYAGLLIYQSRDNTRALSLSGATLSGTVYAANALLSMSGSSQLQGTVVVGTLSLSGSVSLTQLASGSDGAGDSGGIANTLLAGNLQVYINDPAANFTPDMLARIQDAINGWDALLAPYSVTITEVSDPTLANLVIDNGTTSASGSAANGVLGCYNSATGEITIILGWNWYAGADPTQISAGQYDFQTTIEHELGHALGLGGSASVTSPMNETLPDGTARRVMTVADLNIPYPPEGADPITAAGYLRQDQTAILVSAPGAFVTTVFAGGLEASRPLESAEVLGGGSTRLASQFGLFAGVDSNAVPATSWNASDSPGAGREAEPVADQGLSLPASPFVALPGEATVFLEGAAGVARGARAAPCDPSMTVGDRSAARTPFMDAGKGGFDAAMVDTLFSAARKVEDPGMRSAIGFFDGDLDEAAMSLPAAIVNGEFAGLALLGMYLGAGANAEESREELRLGLPAVRPSVN